MSGNSTAIAKFVENSVNAKISTKAHKVSATYSSIQSSCPTTCELRKEGSCYAMSGPIAIHLKRMDANAPNHTPLSTAKEEAALIKASFKAGKVPQDGAKGGRDLRLHVFGDAIEPECAQELGTAATDWKSRDGGDVWTYTHAWASVSRDNWGKDVSVLASIDKIDDAEAAIAQGYAPAMVVDVHNSAKAYKQNGVTWIPCPEQTTGKKCTECRLCFKGDALYARKTGIVFAIHGSRAKVAKKRLQII